MNCKNEEFIAAARALGATFCIEPYDRASNRPNVYFYRGSAEIRIGRFSLFNIEFKEDWSLSLLTFHDHDGTSPLHIYPNVERDMGLIPAGTTPVFHFPGDPLEAPSFVFYPGSTWLATDRLADEQGTLARFWVPRGGKPRLIYTRAKYWLNSAAKESFRSCCVDRLNLLAQFADLADLDAFPFSHLPQLRRMTARARDCLAKYLFP